MSDTKKLSAVEKIKEESNYLRGQIAEQLADGTDNFASDTTQLIKFHGSYQQDNRDRRAELRAEGKDKAYDFMVRTRIPGGRLTSEQLLAELDLCDEIGNTTLRITTRQGLQLHGVLKSNLRQAIHRINEIQLSTLAACGDVERNVMCCPAPRKHNQIWDQLQATALEIAEHLAPKTGAYHELWLTDPETGNKELAGGGKPDVEPIYGETYLPRKFKTAIALPEDNCADIYSNDLGLLAIVEGDTIVGYNVVVGGGMGTTPSAEKTFPAVGSDMAFVTPDRLIDVVTAVVLVQRDFGNRSDRKVARLKYLIADWGLERFKAKVEEYFGGPLAGPRDAKVHGHDDHMGWHEQGDGRWWYGLNVENGRLVDREGFQIKAALREICTALKPGIRLTAHQSVLLTDIDAENRNRIEDILRRHGVPLTRDISNARRWSMACVALPTCGLAVTESERALPGLMDQLDVEIERLGLTGERFTLRMTGCPNGCARPYNSDIGLVGKTAGKYTVFLGGRIEGDRLNFLYKDLVPEEEVVAELARVLAYFKDAREEGESLGDFCHRKGAEDLLANTERYATV
ncbi:MAG: NADPH-dependent assimilatory sulfite reductase hemoprotein subunit [Planctomycetales bacterium]|nr:NADPH-dependent assimilatory sulfite reductase hemoprotein subunit [Planctomycetales bacterium]